MPKAKKRRRPRDPILVFKHTVEGLLNRLDDLLKYEREEQEQLAIMMDPAYTSRDGVYKGQTFAGARDVFISSHLESLEGIYEDQKITKQEIERIKKRKTNHA